MLPCPHLSATSFSNDMSFLPNMFALPPLRADPVNLSEISFHTRSSLIFRVLNLPRDQSIASTPTFFYSRLVASIGRDTFTVRDRRLSTRFSSAQARLYIPLVSKQTSWTVRVHRGVHCSDHSAHPKHRKVRRHGFPSMATKPPRNGRFGISKHFQNSGRQVAPRTALPD